MTTFKEKINVITSVERRRKWTSEEKRSIVQATYQGGMSVSLIARKYVIFPSQLFFLEEAYGRRWYERDR